MAKVKTDLVGAIVVVRDRKYDSISVVARGKVRAVTATEGGDMRLWIEELDAAERECWFGWGASPPRDEVPGAIECAWIGEYVTLTVITKPEKGPA